MPFILLQYILCSPCSLVRTKFPNRVIHCAQGDESTSQAGAMNCTPTPHCAYLKWIDHKGSPISINLRKSSSTSIGARAVGGGWETCQEIHDNSQSVPQNVGNGQGKIPYSKRMKFSTLWETSSITLETDVRAHRTWPVSELKCACFQQNAGMSVLQGSEQLRLQRL